MTNLTSEQKEAAKKLNQRQLAFANFVLEKPRHRKSDAWCYLEAGYKPRNYKAAETKASRLVSNGKVLAYLDIMRETSINKTRLTLEELDKDLEESVFDALITKIVKSVEVVIEGQKITMLVLSCAVEDIPDEIARNIQELKQTPAGIAVKMYNRFDARKLAYDRLGGITKKIEDVTPPGRKVSKTDLEAIKSLIVTDES